MTSFSGMDPELDPELAELMRLEAEERGEAEFVASSVSSNFMSGPLDANLDPELAELMRLEAEERGEGPAAN